MRVLIIDDSPHDRERIVRELQKELGGSEFVEVGRQGDFDGAIARGDFDAVITDYRLQWTDGLRILKTIQERFSHIPVVMVTGAGDEEIAVEGMKSGLSDYLLKGHLQRLPGAVKQSLERSRLRKEWEEAFRQLKVSEERYQIISELTSDYAYSLYVEPDGTLVPEWVTEAFTRISGYTLEEMEARGGWQILIHPEDLPSVGQHFDRVLAGRADVTEFRIVARGGEVRWLRNFNRPVWDELQGRVVRLQGATQDITERKRAEEPLRESEGRYRSLTDDVLDSSAVGVLILDADFRVVWVNQALERYFNLRKGEVVGKDKRHLIRERIQYVFEDPEGFARKVLATYDDNTYIENFECHVLPDGGRQERWLEHWSQPIPSGLYAGGRIEQYYDITGRKRAEEQLRLLQTMTLAISEAKDLYSALEIALHKVCDATGWVFGEAWVPRPDGSCLECSPAWYSSVEGLEQYRETSAGLTLSPGVGLPGRVRSSKRPAWVRDVTGDPNFPRAPFAREAGLAAAMAIPVLSNDEVVAVMGFYAFEPREEDERLIRLVSAVAAQLGSVIRRKLAEDALQESEERFRLLVEGVGDYAIFMLDSDGHVVSWNAGAEQVTGYRAGEILGRHFSCFYPGEESERGEPEEELRGAATEGRCEDEGWRVRKDGSRFWANVVITALRDGEGQLVGFSQITRDLTERKRAEEEKERLQAQLFQSQRLESIGRLAGGVAHDFNNLLTIIQGQADLAMMTLDEGDPLYENLEEVRRASLRAADLTRRLLLFSRKQPLEFTSLDLTRMVEVWLKMLRRLLGEDIAIQTDPASDLWTVQSDARSIEQVILNLVVNARDAMPAGGTLTIRTENVTLDEAQCQGIPEARPGRFVCLSVVDTGVGMDPELLPQIFEPFFTTKEAEKGTGLGLSVAYGIVKRHEGWIQVSSEPGQGSSFTIYLPAFAGKPAEEAPKPVSFQELRGEGERVLLVEDEEEVRGFVAKVLRENGYAVWEAASGEEALDLFEREREAFDLLFSDMILPDRSGLQLVDQLRSCNPGLRVLLGSGYLDQPSQEPTLHERGFRFIQKPYALPELLRGVREVIGGGRGKV